jgi:hypothetical protein
MSFLLHALGVVVLVAGLAWIATLVGVAQVYVAGAALPLIIAGITLAVLRAREHASPPAP